MLRYKFHITNHYALRLSERNLSSESIKDVIYYPDSKRALRTGRHGGKVFEFRKTVEGKTLAVVAEIWKTECWIATAYYEY